MNEKAILDKLFAAGEDENIPKTTVAIKRIGLSFTLRGLKGQKIEELEKRYTNIKKFRGEERRELDRNRFNRAVIAESTVTIGGDSNVRWDHPDLLNQYKASGAEQVIKRVLLSGEINQLTDVVMELSGFYEQVEEEEEVKNLSEEEN